MDTRDFRMKHWSAQAKILSEEADVHRGLREQAIKDTRHSVVTSTLQEWEDRELNRARVQSTFDPLDPVVPLPGGDTLGIFGTSALSPSKGEVAQNEPVNKSFLFEAGAPTDYEVVSIKHMDTFSDVAREQALYDSLQRDMANTEGSMSRLCQLRDNAERDLRQVQEELSEMYREQNIAPRRMPSTSEIATTAVRKNRKSQLEKTIAELQHCIDVNHQKKLAGEAQMLNLSRSIAVRKLKQKDLESSLDAYNNGGMHVLPVVVGRSLQKVPGLEEVANPKERLNAITQQSKLIMFKSMGDAAQKAHKEGSVIDRDLWLKRMDQKEAKTDVDMTLNRLAEIQKKLKGFQTETVKTKLVEALTLFFNSETPLYKVDSKYAGPLCWWTYRRPKMTSNVVPFVPKNAGALGGLVFDEEVNSSDEEEDDDAPLIDDSLIPKGVSLGDGAKGTVAGLIELPKEGIWNILLNVSRRGDGALYESPDPDDYCKVKLGQSLAAMKEMGVFRNRKNPLTGAVLYDVNFVVSGSTLAYHFEFVSSELDERKHLMVGVGQYEEYIPAPLQFMPDPDHPQREKCISSFVRNLQIQKSQGKTRMVELLQELISAEAAAGSAVVWDSGVIQNYPQRYAHDYFLRVLRAEILTESNQLQREEALAARGASGLQPSGRVDLTPELRMKLQESNERYIIRKRADQVHSVDVAKAKVGRYLEIWDKKTEKWRHVLVTECRIRWIENGMVAHIRHVVQELDDIRRPIGDVFSVDFNSVRALDSPIQTSLAEDAEAVRKFEQLQAWNNRLAALDSDAANDIAKRRKEYVDSLSVEEDVFEAYKMKSIQDFMQNIDDEALKSLQEGYAQRTIESLIPECVSELTVGVVERDETKHITLQAREMATERFIAKFKNARMDDLQKKHMKKESALREKMEGKLKELRAVESTIITNARLERKRIEKRISTQKKADKLKLMAKLKFPPAVFAKAVPKSDICEHIHAKAWGNLYEQGVRCKSCGKELNEIHMEESQVLGYGSGAEAWLFEAVKRHRENPAAFRFKTSKELRRVEAERARLEKERWDMGEAEEHFYDYRDIKAIYDFDYRHSAYLKAQGAFRQGVQWSEEDIQNYEQQAEERERKRLQDSGIIVPEKLINFDPLDEVENPPPTFRGEDEKRLAGYKNFMFVIGRVKNFRYRIVELKHERMHFMSERTIYASVLGILHRESFVNEIEFERLERDLDRTGRMLSIYAYMMNLWSKATKILEEAKRELKRCEMRRCGLWESVRESQEALAVIKDQTRELLKLKYIYDNQLEKVEEDLRNRRIVYDKQLALWNKHKDEAAVMLYCKPGEPVWTRYGWATVVQCRFADQMLFVTLGFGSPPARAWIRADEVVQEARSREQAELMHMDLEDRERKRFYSAERTQMKLELALMRAEEERTSLCFKAIDLGVYEKKALDGGISSHINDAYLVSRSKQYIAAQKKKIEEDVSAAVKKRNDAVEVYTGPRKGAPRPMSFWERYDMRKQLAAEMTQKYFKKVCICCALLIMCSQLLGCVA